jgi:hypothetical protein
MTQSPNLTLRPAKPALGRSAARRVLTLPSSSLLVTIIISRLSRWSAPASIRWRARAASGHHAARRCGGVAVCRARAAGGAASLIAVALIFGPKS